MFIVPNINEMDKVIVDHEEPAICKVIVSNHGYQNGTYIITASHVYRGMNSLYGPYHVFSRSSLPNTGWLSRTNLKNANYDLNGVYAGLTTSSFNGTDIYGEYISISIPYQAKLCSYEIYGTNINSWILLGSNDDISFDILDTQERYFENKTIIPLPIIVMTPLIISSTFEHPAYLTINMSNINITCNINQSYCFYKIIITEVLPLTVKQKINNHPVFINTLNLFHIQ